MAVRTMLEGVAHLRGAACLSMYSVGRVGIAVSGPAYRRRGSRTASAPRSVVCAVAAGGSTRVSIRFSRPRQRARGSRRWSGSPLHRTDTRTSLRSTVARGAPVVTAFPERHPVLPVRTNSMSDSDGGQHERIGFDSVLVRKPSNVVVGREISWRHTPPTRSSPARSPITGGRWTPLRPRRKNPKKMRCCSDG